MEREPDPSPCRLPETAIGSVGLTGKVSVMVMSPWVRGIAENAHPMSCSVTMIVPLTVMGAGRVGPDGAGGSGLRLTSTLVGSVAQDDSLQATSVTDWGPVLLNEG